VNLDPELHFEKIVKNYDLLSYIIHPTSSQKNNAGRNPQV